MGIRVEGRLPKVFCSRAGNEIRAFNLGKQREETNSEGSLPSFLVDFASWSACVAYLNWGL